MHVNHVTVFEGICFIFHASNMTKIQQSAKKHTQLMDYSL